MNDEGDALQYYYSTTSGVNFVDAGYFAIGSLIDPNQGAWYIQAGGANGINNSRQIAAAARQGQSGPIGAVLLTPIATSIAGDLNGDGLIDWTDQEIFVAVLLGDDTNALHVNASDLNLDGEVDGRDAQAFVDSVLQ
ncbi:MAG: hypothetical protein IPK83_10970 [Planctomycetes bacterium]|nr:hypothetical protein [Planctomycetota bacterium]